MPQFLTRQSFFQQQPQAAQLPFSQFGGNRPPLQGDTTGGIAFPDAGQPGQPQPQPQPTQSPLSPFLLPTGLSNTELDALLGGRVGTKQEILSIDPDFSPLNRLPQSVRQAIQNRNSATTSTIPTDGIAFEGSGGFDKFNPTLNTGTPLPTLSPTSTTTATNPLNRNLFGGF